jgi:hypothetical protein
MVVCLSAKGLTTGEIQARLAEVYGADVSRQTIGTISDKVVDGMTEWQNRPLDPVYPVIFLDAVHVKIRDGKVANRPIYLALAVTVDGTRDILGLWAGDGGEGAKFWLQILTELKNRGVADACMVVCDGLKKGLPDAIGEVRPEAVVQTCVIHLPRASFRYAGRQHWDAIAKALRPVYTAPTPVGCPSPLRPVQRCLGREVSGDRQVVGAGPGTVRAVFGLRYRDPHRRLLHQRHRVRQRPHPPRRPSPRPLPQRSRRAQVRLPCGDEPTGQGHRRWTMRWKPALNAFDIAFEGRLSTGRK